MKKKASNAEISAIASLLTEISNSSQEITVSVGYRILQNTGELQQHANLYKKERDKIILSYAPDGHFRKEDDPERFAECQSLLSELDGLETEVDIQPIARKDLKGLRLPMKQLIALRFITEDGKEEEEKDG